MASLPIADPSRAMAAVPRGLENFGGTCYIASPLQLILNSEVLRGAALATHPNSGFEALYRAYADTAETDVARAALSQRLGEVYGSLRARHPTTILPLGNAADANAATATLLNSISAPFSITLELDPDGRAQDQLPAEALEAAHLFTLSNLANFRDVTQLVGDIGRPLSGLVMFVGGGHYISYVLKGAEWYKVDDSVVEKVPYSQIESIEIEWLSETEKGAHAAAEETRKALCNADGTPFIARLPRTVRQKTKPTGDYKEYAGIASFSVERL